MIGWVQRSYIPRWRADGNVIGIEDGLGRGAVEAASRPVGGGAMSAKRQKDKTRQNESERLSQIRLRREREEGEGKERISVKRRGGENSGGETREYEWTQKEGVT